MGVLVTNGDSPISLAVARSLGKRGVDVYVGSDEDISLTSHSKYATYTFSHPNVRGNEGGFIDKLVEVVKSKRCEAVFATDWDTYMPISRNRERLTPFTCVPMPQNGVMESADNKAEITKLALELGIPCPKTFFELNAETLGTIKREGIYPMVMKPHVSASSVGMTIVNTPAELEKAYYNASKKHGPMLVQEFIRGQKYSFSGLFNRDGEPRRVCVHRTYREFPLEGGPTAAAVTVKRDDVLEYGILLCKALKWYGVCEMEFLVDGRDDNPRLLDFNPRFFGSISIPIAAGCDYPYLLYRMVVDGEVNASLEYKIGVRGRSMLTGDFNYLKAILNGRKSPQNETGRLKAFMDYLKFYEYRTDHILSLDDPNPALSELNAWTRRKIRACISSLRGVGR
jgi:predicted ATP-grasp superfamily ATP-dependent carboligase